MTKRSVTDFLGVYRAPRLSCRITQRADLLADATRVEAAYRAARPGDGLNDERDQLKRQLAEIAEQIRSSEFEFEFEAVGRAEYDRLVALCPPTPSQRDEGWIWNPDDFPETIISACAVNPTITMAQARELTETLTESQFKKLWNTAIAVNIGDDDAPKFVTSFEPADMGLTSSDTPPSTESPEASSSDA